MRTLAKAKGKKDGAGPLVVGSKVKAYIKSLGGKTGGDVLDGLNCKVTCLLDNAKKRAESNKRTTLRAADL